VAVVLLGKVAEELPSREGPEGKRIGSTGVRDIVFIAGVACSSGPATACSALTRCTGCHELAITSRLPLDERAVGTGWSVTGLEGGAADGVGANRTIGWACSVNWGTVWPRREKKLLVVWAGVLGMEKESWSEGLE
jgi:hypothetical protein